MSESLQYFHIPFCKSRCAYCAFVSSVSTAEKMDEYISAIIAEYDIRRKNPEPETVYIGGGTPSVLPRHTLRRLLKAIADRTNPAALREYTVEVNPEDVTPELLDLLRQYGVSRISMGVQSFIDQELKTICRRHSAEKAIRTADILNNGGWNYSLDLIYGLPGQTPETWRQSLDTLIALHPPHFSAYMLSYEESTPLTSRMERGEIQEASEELIHTYYNMLCNAAREAGYSHYEISNFAMPGHHAVHNSGYWENKEYLGLGAGAAGLINDIRYYNTDNISEYIQAALNGTPLFEPEKESDTDRFNTRLFISLRTAHGLPEQAIPQAYLPQFRKAAAPFLATGLLLHRSNTYTIPEKEWLRTDYIIRSLMI